jgi:hypothetical protein
MCNCTNASSIDIDLHRFICTKCNEIGYYSHIAHEHFTGVKHSEFIETTNEQYLKDKQ